MGVGWEKLGNGELCDKAQKLLSAFFLGQDNKEIRFSGYEISSGQDTMNKNLKKKGHPSYSRPHTEARTSPIEEMMEKELLKMGVHFQKQFELLVEGKKFTVIDFYIPEGRLALYCDGTEFHKDPQRIIMDKKQDRKLQLLGYAVFRFSGSEIVGNVASCVWEVIEMIRSKQE
jgi:very-short-patch-repair endonuclease